LLINTPWISWSIAITALIILLTSYITTAMYIGSYNPLSLNLFENPESIRKRFKEYINDIVSNRLNEINVGINTTKPVIKSFKLKKEGFTSMNGNPITSGCSPTSNEYNINQNEDGIKENIKLTIFDKMRLYINQSIANFFYIKGNTLILSY